MVHGWFPAQTHVVWGEGKRHWAEGLQQVQSERYFCVIWGVCVCVLGSHTPHCSFDWRSRAAQTHSPLLSLTLLLLCFCTVRSMRVVFGAWMSCIFEMPRSPNTFAKMHPTQQSTLRVVLYPTLCSFWRYISSLMNKP